MALLFGRERQARAKTKTPARSQRYKGTSKVKSYSNCNYPVTSTAAGLFTATVKFPFASNRPVLQKSTDAGGTSIRSGLGSLLFSGPPSLHQLDPGVGDKNP
jgi:hypothetical protein